MLADSVDCAVKNTHGVLGFCISVTTGTASPAHVETRVMRFLRRFVPSIGRLTAAAYASNVAACASRMLRDDTNLAEEADRVLAEIESRQYAWDRAEREAAAVSRISRAELVAWAHGVLLNPETRGLSVHAHEGAVAQPAEQPAPVHATAVGDAAAFKAGLKVYRLPDQPLPCQAAEGV